MLELQGDFETIAGKITYADMVATVVEFFGKVSAADPDFGKRPLF